MCAAHQNEIADLLWHHSLQFSHDEIMMNLPCEHRNDPNSSSISIKTMKLHWYETWILITCQFQFDGISLPFVECDMLCLPSRIYELHFAWNLRVSYYSNKSRIEWLHKKMIEFKYNNTYRFQCANLESHRWDSDSFQFNSIRFYYY